MLSQAISAVGRRDRSLMRRAYRSALTIAAASGGGPARLRRPGFTGTGNAVDGRGNPPNPAASRVAPPCPPPDPPVRNRAPASWRSTPTCPARAGGPAAARSTSSRPTRRRSARARRRSRRSTRPTAKLETYPDGARHGAAHGHRQALRARSRADRLRRGLGRAAVAAGLRVWRAGRRGDLLASTDSWSTGSPSWPRAASPWSRPSATSPADVDAILARVTERTRIVYVTNPNNPTGTYLPFDEIRRLHAGLPPHVLLVIDGAYAEYVRANDYSAGLELALESENVVMTRTFSKIHGLAALRIGWMVGAGPRGGRGQPHPRPVQRLGAGHRGGRGGDRRRGAHGGRRRPQRRMAAEAHRGRPRRSASR